MWSQERPSTNILAEKELETHLLILERLSLFSGPGLAPAFNLADEIGKMLLALMSKLEAKRG